MAVPVVISALVAAAAVGYAVVKQSIHDNRSYPPTPAEHSPPYAPTPSVHQLAERLGMTAAEVEAFLSDRIVTAEHDSSNDKDLCLLVAMTVPASLEKAWNFATENRVMEVQDTTLSQGSINLDTFELEGFHFNHGTRDNIEKYAMSESESDTVSNAADKEAAFQKILSARAKAYWEQGRDGVEDYKGNNHDIAGDLRGANKATLKLVRDPMVRKEIETIPSRSTHPEMHSLSWSIVQGNDMTSIVLHHTILHKREKEGFIAIRNKFYSGTDFDASQIVMGVLPTAEHLSSVFYINHTFTAAVTGFGGGVKRSVGRKIMKEKVLQTMVKAKHVLGR